jgi:hypothetical protein
MLPWVRGGDTGTFPPSAWSNVMLPRDWQNILTVDRNSGFHDPGGSLI